MCSAVFICFVLFCFIVLFYLLVQIFENHGIGINCHFVIVRTILQSTDFFTNNIQKQYSAVTSKQNKASINIHLSACTCGQSSILITFIEWDPILFASLNRQNQQSAAQQPVHFTIA